MRLAEYTDYTLRVLMYCASHPGQTVTIGELAERHRVSKNHLMKVVNALARQGLVETVRGRGGGLRLARDPATIRVGDVVRASETDFRLVECFDPASNACSLAPGCRLRRVFRTALDAYFRELDAATLADLVRPARGARAESAIVGTSSAPHAPAAVPRAQGRARARPGT